MTYSQRDENSRVRIMFYNVENLFDIYNDSLTDDDEFLPDGLRRWNSSRYYKKLNSLFKTIATAGEWSPPEIIGFSEVENRNVLEDLISDTYLSRYNYGIIHADSPDSRGIDVAIIYRKDIIQVLDYRSFIPDGYTNKAFTSRSVLFMKCRIFNDTVNIIVNHWPSRIGGALANQVLRKHIAEMVREKADSIADDSNGKARIVIMGDFNCTNSDEELQIITNSATDNHKGDPPKYINLSYKQAQTGLGSYRFQGTWEMLDHIIVSEYLIKNEAGLYTNEESFRVLNADFLQKKDTRYPGLTPFSTYIGYQYQGGASDHLPVFVDLHLK